MNAVKIALLGTAALAAVSVSARADDLADLKAQIESLNSRISQLESTPSLPAGYQLLSVSQADAIIVPGLNTEKDKMYGKKAHNIGVMPTADVPASTNIQWSGFVRAALVYVDHNRKGVDVVGDFDKDTIDVRTRAGLKVVATTDTAVGEVGVRIAMIGDSNGSFKLNNGNGSVTTDGYWGWWKITPELTLGGGVDGSLANSSNAYDNRCTCMYQATGGGFNNPYGDPSQIRLSYASGPISFAVAVEDYDNEHIIGSSHSGLGVAGEMKYSGDSIGFDINGGYWNSGIPTQDDDWTINAGANLALGDIANLGVAVGVGEDGSVTLASNKDRYTKASAFLGFTLSDALSADFGVTYTDYKGPAKRLVVGTGLYYTPVSQLTLGLEASYDKRTVQAGQVDPAGKNTEVVIAGVSVWRF